MSKLKKKLHTLLVKLKKVVVPPHAPRKLPGKGEKEVERWTNEGGH